MREIFKLTATGGTITVNGSVISNNTADFMQEFGGTEDYICPRDITEALSRLGRPTANRGNWHLLWGDMWAGCNIYSALMAYKGPVEYRVYGLSGIGGDHYFKGQCQRG